MNATTEAKFEGWAVLELMGHRKLGGYVTVTEALGAPMLRIDVPGEDGKPVATQFYATSALYALTPTTEDVARALAQRMRPEPVTRWELPPAKVPRDEIVHGGDSEEAEEAPY